MALVPLLLTLGCGTPPAGSPPEKLPPTPASASRFNLQTAGTIQGNVFWEGDLPDVPPFKVPRFLSNYPELARPSERANPNAPVIDSRSRGVGNAVVFLRGVDPHLGRAWDHPPVEVELADLRLQVRQGERTGRYGFIKQGDSIRAVSREALLHALHADGAAFFTLTLPEPGRPRTRPLSERGLVELASGSGYFWMRAYLFVDDHPYYCCTDAKGHFTLPAVPPGRYELVCWLPSWLEARRARDPESGRILRMTFRPPVEKVQAVEVKTGDQGEKAFQLSLADLQR